MDEVDIVIVGAGLSGCIFAEQAATRMGLSSLIIEKRDHIGGNCYDYLHEKGFLVSKYGIHIFHTDNQRVWEYMNRWSEWIPYEHRGKALVNGKIVPVPPNQETINTLFNADVNTEEEMESWLNARRVILDHVKNGEDVILTKAGKELYDAIFKFYTYKQWGKWPVEMDPSVLLRIPIRLDNDDRYFKDKWQAVPKNGYTEMFKNLLNTEKINVMLNTDFFAVRDSLPKHKLLVFTGPIDMYYSSTGLPPLEYRSLIFREEYHETGDDYYQVGPHVNHPYMEVDYTRIIEYKHIPNQPEGLKNTLIVKEYSSDTGEPYYPVPTPRNMEIYENYRQLAIKETDILFVGRLASYKYFNMDQAVLNALEEFDAYYSGDKQV